MQGLMSSYPLTLTHVFDRAERIFPEKEVATVQVGGIDADHLRRMGRAHAPAGRRARRARDLRRRPRRHVRVEHRAPPRAVLRRPCSGRVLHTLNIRLFPDDITYIANHAEDEVVFVDRSLLKVLWPLVDGLETVKHVVVMDDGVDDEIPDDSRIHDYETLLAEADPVEKFSIDDENQAAAMCYTSGTTGQPEGRRLLAPLDRPALAGRDGRRRRRGLRARHRDAGGADVPRQRVGPVPGGRDGGREPRACPAPTCSRRRSRS